MSLRLLVLVCFLWVGIECTAGIAGSATPARSAPMPGIGSAAFLTSLFRHDNPAKDQVVIGRDFTVAETETVEGNVVVIRGNVDVHGAINGNLAMIGSHGDISGTVTGDVACVASAVRLASGCVISGNLTSVASAVENQQAAEVHGNRTNVD